MSKIFSASIPTIQSSNTKGIARILEKKVLDFNGEFNKWFLLSITM